MPVAGVGLGFSSALADYMQSERERNRKQEDDQVGYQMELIKSLAARPDINQRPEVMGQAIHDLMDLANAKGGKTKQKSGTAGFMGQHELPMSQFLSGLVTGSRPMVGPTQEADVENQSEPLAGALSRMPDAGAPTPTTLPSSPTMSASTLGKSTPAAPTGGANILAAPIAMPPLGIQGPPEAVRMIEAGRQVQNQQKMNPLPSMSMKPVASNRQPYFRSPEEMAQQEGSAAGVKAKAVSKAGRDAEREAALEAGLTPDEYAASLKRKLMGPGHLQDAAGKQYSVNGQIINTREVFDSSTGQVHIVDELTGRPLPPNAVPYDKPANATGPVAEYEYYAKNEKAAGRVPLDFNAYQTMDANRKRSTTNVNVRNGQGLTGNQQFQAAVKLQADWQKLSKPYSTMITQYNLMQEGLKQAALGNMNAGSQAVLVTFQKILDPNSVVRESEYDRSPEGVGLKARILGAFQRLSSGGAGVPLNELQQFGTMASQFINGLKSSLDANRAQIDAAARLAGIEPAVVYGNETGLPSVNGAPVKKSIDDLNPRGRGIPPPPGPAR